MSRTIGQSIRHAREQKNLTRSETAKKVGIHPDYLGHLERDYPLRLSDDLRRRLGRALGIRISDAQAKRHNERHTVLRKSYASA